MGQIGKWLIIISLLSGFALGQATSVRTATSTPATCVAGPFPKGMDIIGVCTAGVCTLNICRQPNTWDEVITAAVALTWSSVVGADTYNVYVASVSGGPYRS